MKRILLSLALTLVSFQGVASTVAIIDSGTDMLHKDIYPKAWINELEIAANDRDEDQNGYQDDVHGWNFAESNSEVIDYAYMGSLTFDIRKFFDIQHKMMIGSATQEEVEWMKSKRGDAEFIKKLSVYGNFMHGTHVAGIAVKEADDAKVLAVKIIPTEVKLPGQAKMSEKNGLGLFLLKQGLKLLAGQQMKMLAEVGAYIDGHKADIANGSFGTGYPQSKMIVETLAKSIMAKNPPTEEQIHELTLSFIDELIREGTHFVANAPNTLFVFAAGNDGLDNDKYPTSPTNIESSNVISVSATIGLNELANFSNYGETKVDVAAPGVGIDSTVPGNKYLKVSGTSQAAPYVANIAAGIKDMNTDLVPGQIKKIIMETVDKKDFLAKKVVSKGLVNKTRAIRAAELSRTMSLAKAINTASIEVEDQKSFEKASSVRPSQNPLVLPLPNMFKL